MKSKKDFVKSQLNIERLTPNQWDGVMRAMDAYAEHYHQMQNTRPARDEVFNLLKRFAEYEFDFGNNSHQAGDYAKHFMESDAFKSVMNIDNDAVRKSYNSASPTTSQIVEAVKYEFYNDFLRYYNDGDMQGHDYLNSIIDRITNAINSLKQNL